MAFTVAGVVMGGTKVGEIALDGRLCCVVTDGDHLAVVGVVGAMLLLAVACVCELLCTPLLPDLDSVGKVVGCLWKDGAVGSRFIRFM